MRLTASLWMPRHSKVFSANCPTPGDAVAESWSTNRCSRQRPPNLGAGEADMSARPLAKDIIPDEACIGVLGQSLAAAPLGVRVVENLRPVASPDKEQSTEGQHAPGL